MIKRANVVDELLASLADAPDIMEEEFTPPKALHRRARIDVRAIRERSGLSQRKFAERFGFNVISVRDWEQSMVRPRGAARVLLMVMASKPEVVDEVLAAAKLQAAPVAAGYATPARRKPAV